MVANETQSPALLPHQQAELHFLQGQPRGFLFSETGTGKTPVLLSYAARVLQTGGRVLWLTEAGLITQFVDECRRWLPQTLPRPTNATRTSLGREAFVVASLSWVARNRSVLEQGSWDLVVVDEADAVAGGGLDPTAATFDAVRNCVHRSSRSVLATATPVATTHGLDLHALLDAGAAPRLLPRHKFEESVRFEHHDNGYGGSRKVPIGLNRAGVDHLRDVVSRLAIATRLHDIGLAIPGITRRTLHIPLTQQQQDDYDKVRRTTTGLVRHQRSMSAAQSPQVLARAVVRTVDHQMAQGHRHIIVFAETLSLVSDIQRALDAAGVPCFLFIGDMRPRVRSQVLMEHRERGGVLVGTRALETGLNLQYSSSLISVVSTWSHSRELQREGRLRRVGSPHTAVEHITLSPNVSLETRKLERLQRKSDLLETILSAVPSPMTQLAP